MMAPTSVRLAFPAITLLFLVLSLDGAEEGSGLDDVKRWRSSNMEVLRERRAEMESGIETELEARLVRAEAKPWVITVRQDGTGDYRTVTEAVDSVPAGNSLRVIIRIGRGVYREKVTVAREKPFVTFFGEEAGEGMPKISFDGTAAEYGTVYSATVAVESNHFMAVNVAFENSAPMPAPGVEGAQAVALRISGDKAAFFNCRFYGYQDTLCDDKGKHFFSNCYIRGTVDFIFGNGRSIYLNCEIHSVATGMTALTAQARQTVADKSGFSFVQCTVNGSGTAVLSRAWRNRSLVVFAYTYMGSLVNPRGWDDMGRNDRDRTVFYGEYKCTGPGASTNDRVGYAKILTQKQAKAFLSPKFIHARTWLLPPPSLKR